MLTSLIIQLTAPTDARLPAALGRASQALLLRLVQQVDPPLADALHHGDGPRPYTASNLVLGRRAGGSLHIQAGQTGWLRFTGLTRPVSQTLQALAADPPASVEVDGQPFTVTGATLDPAVHPWAGQISYQDLAAPFLLAGQAGPPARIRLEFVSPTTFKSRGRFVPLPLPELVFGSLLDRWQTFAPVALNPELRRFAAEVVHLTRYDLQTRAAPYKQQGLRVGFTGQADFTAANRDRYWLNMLHLLAAFAFYSGVGYGTASGLGQARAIGR
ncbi:MAG: CRISPR system precrRNA processing endoribonuclease RAMP protein Cas6 [Chloroflexi bacterium]|nr:MAG: CRISPR system precrRNA processing endoribonuclease RAMP protein Cas6 [Chloroflexota bacterium]